MLETARPRRQECSFSQEQSFQLFIIRMQDLTGRMANI